MNKWTGNMANTVRARVVPSTFKSKTTQRDSASGSTHEQDVEIEPPITTLDLVRLLFGLLAVNLLLSYFITGDSFTWGYSPWWLRPKVLMQRFNSPVILTDAELVRFDGSDPSLPVYLGLNGTIYDVSAGRVIYGPGGMYSHFAGRDAARAFITGCFADDANPDLRGAEWTYVPRDVPHHSTTVETAEEQAYRKAMLAQAQASVEDTIAGWAKLFRGETGKDYFEVGRIDRPRDFLRDTPIKILCEQAEKNRPRTNLENSDAGAKYRKDK